MSDWWAADPIASPSGKQSGYADAIASVESGGKYHLIGPTTRDGDRAHGKYQVMGKNVGPWTREALGREMTPQEFVANPEAQEAVFQHKFGGYVNKYGPEGAARAWFAGEGGMNDPGRKDVLGTSVAGYAAKFSKALSGQRPASAQENNWWSNDPVAKPVVGPGPNQGPEQPQSSESPKQNGSIVDTALSPLTQFPEIYRGMKNDSLNQAARGVDQIKAGISFGANPSQEAGVEPAAGAVDLAKGVGNVALGGVGYLASPFNAAINSFVGKPVQNATGIPAEYTDFAASLAVPGVGMTRMSSIPTQTQRTLTAGEEVTQAGKNLAGIGNTGPVDIPKAVTSDSTAVQRAASTIRNVPFAGDPIVNAAGRAQTQLGQKSQDIAGAYGGGSAVTAGDTAGASIRDWIKAESAATSKKFYDRVDALVNPAIKTDLIETRNEAQNILNRRANAAISEPSAAVKRIEDAVTTPGGLNYEGIKDLRTYIGELKDKPQLLPADISEKELGKIYTGLSKDLSKAVSNAGGPAAESAFNRANTHYRLVSERRESLAKIVGVDGNAPAERVFDNVVSLAGSGSRADIARLSEARKVMKPDEWNEVASAAIARMGRTEEMGGGFSPQKFLTAYQDKLSKPGRDLLFRSAGKESIAPYLDDIATVATRFKELQKFANPSGTGQIGAGVGIGAGVMTEPITTLSGLLGARVVAHALSTPATVAPIAQWSKSYYVAFRAPTPANIALLTVASRNLANTINSRMGLDVTPDALLKAIRGNVPARAEDEQPPVPGVRGQ